MASAEKAWSPSAWLGTYSPPKETSSQSSRAVEPAPKPKQEAVSVQSPKLRVVHTPLPSQEEVAAELRKSLAHTDSIPVFSRIAARLLQIDMNFMVDVCNFASDAFHQTSGERAFVDLLRNERHKVMKSQANAKKFAEKLRLLDC